jgi:DNA-binding transcriptional MerR regulator
MSDLLSVLALSKRLNIPESTCRYYCRQYADFLPTVGDGRGKRYREGALEVLQVVVNMAKDNRSSTDIASHLRQQFPVNMPSASNHQQQSLTSYYQGELPSVFKDFLTLHAEIINKSLAKDKLILEQAALLEKKSKKIEELNKENERLKRPWYKKIFKR